jgi:membrane protein DedA with SNARE-associated domain
MSVGFQLETLLLAAAAAFAQEDLGSIGSGVTAGRGHWPWWAALFGCLVGSFFADLLWYVFGRAGGRWALERAPLKWIMKREQIAMAERWFARRGLWTIVLCRFVPGASTPLQFATGALNIPLKTALGYFVLATLAHVPLLFGAGYLVGDLAIKYLPLYHRWGLFVAAVLAVVVWLVLRTAERLLTQRELPATDT